MSENDIKHVPLPRIRIFIPSNMIHSVHYDIATDLTEYAEWAGDDDETKCFVFRGELLRKAYRIATWLARFGVPHVVHFDGTPNTDQGKESDR